MCCRFGKKGELRPHFNFAVLHWRQRNVQKSMITCKVVFCQSKALSIAFFPFSFKTVLAALLRTIKTFISRWPFHHRKFGFFHFFWSVMSTEKPVNRSKHAYTVTQLNVLAFRGFFSFIIFSNKKKEGVWENRATQYKNYEAGKCTCARAPLKPNDTNRILESQGGTTSINC